jgi:predicted metal-dependent phosphoesterase TrpH
VILDLHTHSTASDGRLSPAELVEKAFRAGLGVMALTDHDTVSGLDEAGEAARTLGIGFVRGVEIEIEWPEIGNMESREFHLLGLGIGKPGPKLQRILLELGHKRERRNRLIIERMREMGIDASLDEIREQSGVNYIGRPHFASYLISKKKVKDNNEAFRRYLANGKPLYVPKGGVKLLRAVKAIKESCGLSVVAHPVSLYISWGKLPVVFERFKQSGIDGIEAYHPNCTERESRRFIELAEAFNFYISAGSDYHSDERPDRKIGHASDGMLITDSIVTLPYTRAEGARTSA